jgi:hypothetical protein
VSINWLLDASEILIKQFDELISGTVQAKMPAEALVLTTIVVQLEPLFVEYSILTFATPENVHVILWDVPTVQFSPPLGEVNATDSDGEIVKTELLIS